MSRYLTPPVARPGPAVIPRRGWDATTVLTIGLVLTCAVPSYLSVPTLGPMGRPGALWFLGAFLWWMWHHLHRPFPVQTGPKPVRLLLFVLLGCILVSYALSNFVGLPEQEAALADGGVLRALSWAGVLLIAHDGVVDSERFVVMLRRTAVIGGLMAALGLMQFWTGQSLVSSLYIPGMQAAADFDNVQTRSGFTRAAATASHPLEYATVLCMSLPIAIALAVHDSRRGPFARWWPVALVSAAAALSVSRSALVGMAAGVVVLALGWPRRARIKAAALGAVALMATYVLVPGMAGTILGMFIGLGEDSSAASRTSSFPLALDFAARNLVAGRGLGTFLPSYRILDNQYLGLLIEIGLVGLVAFLALIATGMLSCLLAWKRLKGQLMGDLSYALFASLVAGAVTFAFFDALTFPMAAVFMLFFLGMSGALWSATGAADSRDRAGERH